MGEGRGGAAPWLHVARYVICKGCRAQIALQLGRRRPDFGHPRGAGIRAGSPRLPGAAVDVAPKRVAGLALPPPGDWEEPALRGAPVGERGRRFASEAIIRWRYRVLQCRALGGLRVRSTM